MSSSISFPILKNVTGSGSISPVDPITMESILMIIKIILLLMKLLFERNEKNEIETSLSVCTKTSQTSYGKSKVFKMSTSCILLFLLKVIISFCERLRKVSTILL